MMFVKTIIGVALIFLSAAPSWSSSLEQPWVLDFSTGVTRAYFSVDTQINVTDYVGGYGWIKFSLGDVITPLIVGDLICDSSKQFSFTTYACDGTSYTSDITPTGCIVDGTNVLKHYTFPSNATFQPICVSSAVVNFPTQIYPVEFRYLNIGYTPVAIQQAVYSSTGALADFFTFAPNENGGKAAWLFGCFLALMFIFGIRVGMRS